MGLFLVWCHRPICTVLCLCKHACKEVCDVNPGIDPYPLLARLCDRWWPDFVTFTACKKSRFGLQRGKEAQCVSNRSKDLYERKKYFGVRCTLTWCYCWFKDCCSLWTWIASFILSWKLVEASFQTWKPSAEHLRSLWGNHVAIIYFHSSQSLVCSILNYTFVAARKEELLSNASPN